MRYVSQSHYLHIHSREIHLKRYFTAAHPSLELIHDLITTLNFMNSILKIAPLLALGAPYRYSLFFKIILQAFEMASTSSSR